MKKRGTHTRDNLSSCAKIVSCKRSQMQLSFGMIFSVILIIIFISFAIYGISKFLNLQKNIQTKKFVDDLQFDIDRIWKANQGSQQVEYNLPIDISSLCFNSEGEGDNLEFRRRGGGFGGAYSLEHVNLEDNFCVQNIDGKVKMRLSKEFGEALVRISE